MELPQDSKKLNEFNSNIEANDYKLRVKTTEYYWNNGGVKCEDLPGNFLYVEVRLIGTSDLLINPSALELLAVEKQVVLHRHHREITDEPDGYAKLWHDYTVKKIKKTPSVYLQNLAEAVKKSL